MSRRSGARIDRLGGWRGGRRIGLRVRVMARWTAVWLPVFLVAVALDRWAYHAFLDRSAAIEDWVQVLRQMGYLPTWVIVGMLLWLLDRSAKGRSGAGTGSGAVESPRPARPAHHRGGLVLVSAITGGIFANVLKPLIGRLRPDPMDGIARFAHRDFLFLADQGEIGFGLPSGHTTVAFSACGMVALLVPAWRWPMMILAIGCAYTRLMAGAHALSDTVAGAWLGLAVAAWLFAWGEGARRGPANGLIPRES